jgi:hypothetical protein
MPEHEPVPDEGEYEDDEPSPEELVLIRSATPDQASAVDHLLVAACSTRWRKVAMVVGASLDEYARQFPDLPYVYMQLRLLSLVERGVLEAQGDIMAMRHSEVRLAEVASAA